MRCRHRYVPKYARGQRLHSAGGRVILEVLSINRRHRAHVHYRVNVIDQPVVSNAGLSGNLAGTKRKYRCPLLDDPEQWVPEEQLVSEALCA